MSFSARMPARMLHELADTHPKLSPVVKRLTDLGVDRQRAVGFARAILTHAVEDFGDAWLGETSRRLKRIDHIRSRISAAVDQVIEHGALPPELNRSALSGLFDDLQREMDGLKPPLKFADGDLQKPDIARMRGAAPAAADADAIRLGQHTAPDATALSADAKKILAADPKRAELIARLRSQHGDELGLAIIAQSEMDQNKRLAALIAKHKPPLSAAEEADLRAAVKDLGIAQSRAQQGPGTLPARMREEALAKLPDDLRAAIGNDRTILGDLAVRNPEQLRELWAAWNAGPKTQRFQAYVRGEMPSHFRPYQAEFTSAFELGQTHGVAILKDPASFDPRPPNQRRVNPREGGSDIVGLRKDGEIWFVDDKSHRGATGVSQVSAFQKTLPQNMLDDAADIEAGLQRARAAGHPVEPAVVEAAARMKACGRKLKDRTAGWSEADFLKPENQKIARAVLDEHRVKLKVTSAMGDVTHVTDQLKELGIEVIPPVSAGP